MAKAADVFISYSREDKDKVLELTEKLRAAGVPHASDHAIEPGALAVLPFDNISPDEETDYFSDGLTSTPSAMNLSSRR